MQSLLTMQANNILPEESFCRFIDTGQMNFASLRLIKRRYICKTALPGARGAKTSANKNPCDAMASQGLNFVLFILNFRGVDQESVLSP